MNKVTIVYVSSCFFFLSFNGGPPKKKQHPLQFCGLGAPTNNCFSQLMEPWNSEISPTAKSIPIDIFNGLV